ncbi:CDP-alcohol phosphatidyltransferase family protein [Arthrobacter sp. AK04]|jgi:CDP-diacylglycerol--glycerol-3-phosphate 3-phosphatidyltransferase|uniref:Phosphatidylinositol phosphate synthase n=1 Tax=Pseudarthrobacter oxydans TaxID=1671 RepID=A0AAW8NB18_PSEOX|nr:MULTISPECIES: CDP-alcohol phosphatidyltransferase family protein [Micrococcaceae]MBA4102341.1 CDP-alcohol phosphatidyltransferase [Arthrobacter sp.]MDV2979370.1 CDP-alcohol phosphatidyltransferase family protein [Actinomycetes bacterium ARC8]WHP57584.1 CDP-alcohol phosphatidyltransferase family protein [Arthrobacter sp. KFRI-F3372]MCD5343696.1 CDP-alcohol phosphatidyltransferase family protein [Arthrobacter sp. AK04]MDR6793245.1 CDP-diacylglycerol--glycerol-3-phosphate 3-phosphatidyltransfe
MLNRHARGFFTALFSPLARWLLKIGISPDAVTVIGTAGVVVGALVFYPLGQLWWGTLFITAFIFSDVLDGIMARMREVGSRWGNFLDSTLDRIADGALFAGLAVWFFTGGANVPIAVAAMVCLVLGMVVSYARAKAESLGFTANTGIAERAERLVSVLVVTGFTGLGLPEVVLLVTLLLLAVASFITVVQRVVSVRRQALAEPSPAD